MSRTQVVGWANGTRVRFAAPVISDEARTAALRVLASGWVTTGPEVAAFEEEFAELVRTREAVAMASCTHAIEIALRGLGLPPGSRVLVPTMTFCGAVGAIVHAGLRPVLTDVDAWTLMPTPQLAWEAADRAGGVEAMMVLHFGGFPAPVEELRAAVGLPLERVVEDAAHALGTWTGTAPVGGGTRAACFSFYATKNLPIGEGGMLSTDDTRLAAFARRVRLHGMSADAWRRYEPGTAWRYSVEVDGLKANMTDLQAAIGRAQLAHLFEWQHRRGRLAHAYDRTLAGLPGLALPPRPLQGRHGWSLYVIQVSDEFGVARDRLIAELSRLGVDCSVHFIPVHHFPYFRDLLALDGRSRFPGADTAFERILSLPLHPGMSEDDVARVGLALEEARGGAA
jgi:perosamine synthetase